jgi:hypothetical protein
MTGPGNQVATTTEEPLNSVTVRVNAPRYANTEAVRSHPTRPFVQLHNFIRQFRNMSN